MARFVTLMIAALLVAFAPSVASAQDSNEELKKKILERVEKKLEEEREKTIATVEKILDEALAGREEGDTPDRSELKALVKELESLRSKLDDSIAEARELLGGGNTTTQKPDKKDDDSTAKKDDNEDDGKPLSQEELQAAFQKGMEAFQAGKYESSIKELKKIARSMPKHEVGYTAMYNIACAYCLMGDADNGFEWLEKSIRAGFSKADHMEGDSDLEILRKEDEARWKKLVKLARAFRS
jgi:TolA-binding protein